MLTDAQAETFEQVVEAVVDARRGQPPVVSVSAPVPVGERDALMRLTFAMADVIGWRAADQAVTSWIITRHDIVELAYYWGLPGGARVRLPDGREGVLEPVRLLEGMSEYQHPDYLYRWVCIDDTVIELHRAPTLTLLDDMVLDPPPARHLRPPDPDDPTPDAPPDRAT